MKKNLSKELKISGIILAIVTIVALILLCTFTTNIFIVRLSTFIALYGFMGLIVVGELYSKFKKSNLL